MTAVFFEGLEEERVMIVGDIMLDRYLYGDVHRISPEAPVPIVSLTKEDNKIGGAGNVALNVAHLGCQVRLLSLIGNDDSGKTLAGLLPINGIDNSYLLKSQSRKTTVKSRVISTGQHLLRVDSEDIHCLDSEEETMLINTYNKLLDEFKPTLVLLQDYDKGVLSENFISFVLNSNKKRNIFTAVDPKKRKLSVYSPCNLIKPNLKEFGDHLGHSIEALGDELEKESLAFLQSNDIENIVVTLSEHGIFLKSKDDQQRVAAGLQEIVDVCGAGDAVFAVVALAIKRGLSLKQAGILGNGAGSIVCKKVGVVAIESSELKQIIL